MKILGVIPARYDSSRFPGKPLALIGGKPMIEHVYWGSRESTKISDLIVATDDFRIKDTVDTFGGRAMLTGTHHQTGTSRCIEVAQNFPDVDWVINIQGDEPMIHAGLVDQVVDMILQHPLASIVTMVRKINNLEDVNNPNMVKCVFDTKGKALYFSRSPIPYYRAEVTPIYYQHVGIYAFKSTVLNFIAGLKKPAPLESAESLEQLRWLEHGLEIYTGVTEYATHGVDTPSDIEVIEKMMRQYKASF